MPEIGLWGDLGKLETVKSPVIYLREQAELLGPATSYVLQGEVSKQMQEGRLTADLNVVVPSLNQYRLSIVSIMHKLEAYPVRVTSITQDIAANCATEEIFVSWLKAVLSSEKMKRILGQLLSQAKA